MSGWSDGYVSEILYTTGYYRELAPSVLQMAALASNHRHLPLVEGATYCELGCGMGFTANLLAAANPHIQFHATDFNPAQIVHAEALAREAGTPNLHFYDCSFAEFVDRPELPAAFDMITLHGIYSWVSAQNRAHIVEFIRRKLKPGGLVYISYNALPGWAAAMPLRRLMLDHVEGSAGPLTKRIDEALEFLLQLDQVGARYFRSNAGLKERVEKLKPLSRNYLAHEYFNRDWTPFYFQDVASELEAAKLSFLGSASLLEQVDAINYTPDQLNFLATVSDPVRSQGLRDVMLNQQFRRDVFARGGQRVPLSALKDEWGNMRFALSTRREEIPLKVSAGLGEATMAEAIYNPLLDVLARGPATLREMVSADRRVAEIGLARLTQALVVLVGSGHVQPCLPARDEQKRTQRARALNSVLMRRAEINADYGFLASPVTGAGIQVDRVGQLFLAARQQKVPDVVARVWSILSEMGQRLLKDGKPIETEEANLAHLRTMYLEFEDKKIPTLQKLGIA